jgi:hypothetical protein
VQRNSVPSNRKLTATDELTFLQWILSIDQRGLAPSSNIVGQIALLLQKRCDQN